MRVVFAGSPDVALPSLQALLSRGENVVGVLTQPDRPVGRKRLMTPTPVAAFAREQDIPVYTPGTQSDLFDTVTTLSPDLAIAVAYGRIIDPRTLTIPTHGWWNLHFSLLPRWRGATPVQHTLLAGEKETGVSVFAMDEGLDTGAVLGQSRRPVADDDTAGSLLHALSVDGAALLVSLLDTLREGRLDPVTQNGSPSYAPKLSRPDGKLHWSEPATLIRNRFRAVTPEPGAFTEVVGKPEPLGILALRRSAEAISLEPGRVRLVNGAVLVGTADDPLELVSVQPAGKKEMSALAWWNGTGGDVRLDA